MYPQPGGDYTYILDSLGPFIGFVRLWAECLIVRPCTITIVALTFAKYSIYNKIYLTHVFIFIKLSGTA